MPGLGGGCPGLWPSIRPSGPRPFRPGAPEGGWGEGWSGGRGGVRPGAPGGLLDAALLRVGAKSIEPCPKSQPTRAYKPTERGPAPGGTGRAGWIRALAGALPRCEVRGGPCASRPHPAEPRPTRRAGLFPAGSPGQSPMPCGVTLRLAAVSLCSGTVSCRGYGVGQWGGESKPRVAARLAGWGEIWGYGCTAGPWEPAAGCLGCSRVCGGALGLRC